MTNPQPAAGALAAPAFTPPPAWTPEAIRTHLRAHARRFGRQRPGYRYTCHQDFVAVHGRPFTPAPLPAGLKPGSPRACYANAYRLARRRGLVYVEGFAVAVGLEEVPPMLHAWCMAPAPEPGAGAGAAVAVDPTWRGGALAYLGVAFDLAFVQGCRRKKASVLDAWEDRWPLLRADLPEEQWKYQPQPEAGSGGPAGTATRRPRPPARGSPG